MIVPTPQLRHDAEGHAWDIQADGSIAVGDAAAFDGGLVWLGFPPQPAARLRKGGRTVDLGPVMIGGLECTRSVHVPLDEPWVRYVDTMRNPTASPVTYRFRIQSGVDIEPIVATAQSSDGWVLIDDGVAPVIANVFGGSSGSLQPAWVGLGAGSASINYDFEITLAPGAAGAILHFALQAPTRALAVARAEALLALAGSAVSGLDAVEGADSNFGVPRPISSGWSNITVPPLGHVVTRCRRRCWPPKPRCSHRYASIRTTQ